MKTKHRINLIQSGKPYVEEGPLPRSSKDMIERRKAQR